MKEYIIDHPHVLSFPKRLSGWLIGWLCGLMWIYLMLPIVILVAWLLGNYQLNDEIRWFGGYKDLKQLLYLFMLTLGGQCLVWITWLVWRSLRRKQRHAKAAHARVTDQQLSAFYHVDAEVLADARQAQLLTVIFDEHGKIMQIRPEHGNHAKARVTRR
ncbi:MAG: poly-beta-1,6-N-acetyl-D-glucosamine biosynthesis protein PgaD [Methylovulum sp.]|jgi:poly-beta-1,6-N-acetyl-D-glucosamine biosynthesis protein PgaD